MPTFDAFGSCSSKLIRRPMSSITYSQCALLYTELNAQCDKLTKVVGRRSTVANILNLYISTVDDCRFTTPSWRRCQATYAVAQPGFGGGGTGVWGTEVPQRGPGAEPSGRWFGGIASRKLIAVIKDIWLPNHAQFCVGPSLAQRRSQEFSCEPNFGGGCPRPPGCATVHM